jgi:hypothetical protein
MNASPAANISGLLSLWTECTIARSSMRTLKSIRGGTLRSAEEIDNLTTITGIFPMHLVMTDEVRTKLENLLCPAYFRL